jgi:hypothetical protein
MTDDPGVAIDEVRFSGLMETPKKDMKKTVGDRGLHKKHRSRPRQVE